MTPAWTRRLELLFGEPLTGDLSAEAIHGLVETAVSEDEQLDFKVLRYEATEKGRAELAKDVCAFANRLGGVLVLGVADMKGVASAPRPLKDVADADARHIRNVLASWCAPVPDVDVILVSAENGAGFIVIVVPPSPRKPHAVAAPTSDLLGWPVRHGTQTRWLTESEIADAYRARASRITEERTRLEHLAAEASDKLERGAPWLLAVLVPAASPGPGPIDAALVERYRDWFQGHQPEPPQGASPFGGSVCRAGPRRVVFARRYDRPWDGASGSLVELHTDGAAVAAVQMHQPGPDRGIPDRSDVPRATRFVTDEQVANVVLAALQLLTMHALHNAGCWAEATVLLLLTDGKPPRDGAERGIPDGLADPIAFGHRRHFGIPELLPNTVPTHEVPLSTATIDIAAVATSPTEALAAAHMLGGGLLNAVGHPELAQYTADGRLRKPYFGYPSGELLAAWAARHGVDVTDETLE